MDTNSSWYLGSACVIHIYHQKVYFDLLHEKMVKNLVLGDKLMVKVIGLEVLRIKMFDRVVLFLSDVTYVLKMPKNLISLSLFDSQGFKFSIVMEC